MKNDKPLCRRCQRETASWIAVATSDGQQDLCNACCTHYARSERIQSPSRVHAAGDAVSFQTPGFQLDSQFTVRLKA